MNILIRLPNWMGDMVMSTAFVRAVQSLYPQGNMDLIVKKGLDPLLDFFPAHGQRFIFSKEEYPGMTGAWKFGKQIARTQEYDLFFCLPDSLSSAVMAFATGARKRIGYRKEGRGLLLSHAFNKPTGLHRVEEYTDLLRQFSGQPVLQPAVTLVAPDAAIQDTILININSEAVSRRLPKEKATAIIEAVRAAYKGTILLAGSRKEASFVASVYAALNNRTGIVDISGHTGIPELVGYMRSARAVLSTDSGPAHLANALGRPLLVLFGAGNEEHTGPYRKGHCQTMRLDQLPCEPCTRNECKPFGLPRCLTELKEDKIVTELMELINRYE